MLKTGHNGAKLHKNMGSITHPTMGSYFVSSGILFANNMWHHPYTPSFVLIQDREKISSRKPGLCSKNTGNTQRTLPVSRPENIRVTGVQKTQGEEFVFHWKVFAESWWEILFVMRLPDFTSAKRGQREVVHHLPVPAHSESRLQLICGRFWKEFINKRGQKRTHTSCVSFQYSLVSPSNLTTHI